MIDNNQKNDLSQLYSDVNSKSSNSTDNIKKLTFKNIESILKKEDNYHYLCPKCHIFPFIEFTNSKKSIKFTC